MERAGIKTILIVEDEPIIALAGKTALEDEGFRVRVAKSGEDAIVAVESDPAPDLVLMDINLGEGMDGTEAARRILERRDLPLIFHSSHSERDIVEKTEGITSYGYILKNSGDTVLNASIKMAFRLFDAKLRERAVRDELDAKNRYLESMLETTKDGFWLVDSRGAITSVNAAYCRMSGYPREELVGMAIRDLDAVETEAQTAARMERIRSCGHETFRTRHRRKDGTILEIEMSVSRVQGPPEAFVCFGRDVTAQVRMEAELRRGEERFRLAMEATSDGLWDWDAATGEVYYGPNYWRMIGYEPGEIAPTMDAWSSRLHPEDYGRVTAIVDDCSAGRCDSFSVEFRFRTKNCGWRWILGRGTAVGHGSDGRALRMIGTHVDISERKRAEESVTALLGEKDFLLRETHHRITNFMTTIHATLSLQSKTRIDPSAKSALEDAAGRVRNMMGLYARLYGKTGYGKLAVRLYLEPLMGEIMASFAPERPVSLETGFGDFVLPAKTVTAIGIILNELVTNSMKHAFADTENPAIRASVTEKNGEVVVSYADNGRGLPPGTEFGDSSGFGLRMISMMAEQLGGEAKIAASPEGGAAFEVAFAPEFSSS